MKKGKLIAAFGMPGTGKSTVTKELGKLLASKTFHEPEEKHWGKAVSERDICGYFTAIMWFRSTRIPLLYNAKKLADSGEVIFLDSYYDKLFSLYIEKEGMKWLLNKEDPYFKVMINIAKIDYKILPDVDILIFFKLDLDTWIKFLKKRNRNLDNEASFRESFITQKYFLDAAIKYCSERGVELIIFEQYFSSPQKTAKQLKKVLVEKYL